MPETPPPASSSAFGLRLIGGFKVFSALLLAAAGVGVLRMVNADLNHYALRLISWIKLDPHNQHIHALLEKLTGVQPKQLRLLGVGTILYGLLYMTEGVGLLLRKPWAEYLTVVATGLFIPLELYEVFHKPNAPKIVVLILNIAIVAYVANAVRRRKQAERAEKQLAGAAAPAPAAS